MADPLVGEEAAEKLLYYPTTTRESSPTMGRITHLFEQGKIFEDLGLPPLGADDRVMICGSLALNTDMKAILEASGLEEGSNSMPNTFVIEKAFVG